MNLSDLFVDIPHRVQQAGTPTQVHRVAAHAPYDTHTVFLCRRTPLYDGHLDALSAFAAGCRVFVAERPLSLPTEATVLLVEDTAAIFSELAARCTGFPARSVTVFGVSGEHGKTTVIRIAEHILQNTGHSVASLTVKGRCVNGTLTAHGALLPDAADVMDFLRDAVESGTEFVLLECSTYLSAQHTFDAVPFTANLLTDKGNVSFDAPIRILPAGSDLPVGKGVVTFGRGGDFSATDVAECTIRGVPGRRFRLTFGNDVVPITLPIPGDPATADALAAAALAAVAGVTLRDMASAFATAHPRECLCPLTRGKPFRVFCDGAYDAARLTLALRTLRAITEGKLLVLLGSVGGRAFERRAALGRAAYTYADLVYFTADDPDDEDIAVICDDMMADLTDIARCFVIPDRAAAIREAIGALRAGDTLLLAGKGEQTWHLVHGERVPFDEARMVKEALQFL